MAQKYERRVTVSKNGYTLKLIFCGVYPEFEFMEAQAGDVKGVATLKAEGVSTSIGNIIFPINLDYVFTAYTLCRGIENKNGTVDQALVEELYEQALKKMKKEE